ncbi:oligosaccharide flippase family protein [Vibrio cholerae]|uniref:oligosaccharide flippase family protein n=1 Tax=Vibrio cholerae TaxID=666 RepID=UPI0018F0A218|nr:oligosaccharide flippase family protein [Vibrio cholerae]MBJ6879703.1 oligosaccharide flippase family protein [Vibrio cholerae]MBJ6883406.1 oligosaccharide flippase family protein [Vibrio cholerae]MBJ6890765.1 oligosaccharide flippase family protein [Vibrio cholerae]
MLSIKNNIALAMLSKASSLMASFVMIPILLKSLGTEDYGLWVTLSSIAAWLLFFDFGLGNSFKNSVATQSKEVIKKEFSIAFSLYCYVAIVLVIALVLFLTTVGFESDETAFLILYLPLCILFPLRLFSFGLEGLRQVGLNSILETLRAVLWLVFAVAYVLYFDVKELHVLSIIFVVANILPQIIQLVIFKRLCGFSLKPCFISPSYIVGQDSFKLGIKFFIIQLSSLVSFNLGNVLVYNHFGASHVATYDIFNKVFVAALSIFNMSIAVMWPEISKAYAEYDFKKCKKYHNLLILIATAFSFGLLVVGFNFNLLLTILGVDNVIIIDWSLLWSVCFLTCLQSIAYCGAVFLNATGKLSIQIALAFISIVLIYPLFQVLFDLSIGIKSYPLAVSIMVLIGAVVYNLQARLMLKENHVH